MGRLGSYDPDACHLVIVDHDFYPELNYASGYWRRYDNPFDGDVLSVYIDGRERERGCKVTEGAARFDPAMNFIKGISSRLP